MSEETVVRTSGGVIITCNSCGTIFDVASSVVASRNIDKCVACYRASILITPSKSQAVFSPDFIERNVYLGGFRCAQNLNLLQHLNITHVIAYTDEENITQTFEPSIEFIQSAKGNVLVHCFAGVSRSASIVLAFLMKINNMSLEDARKFLKSKRRCICPNDGFIKQLASFKSSLTYK
eukprot:gene726-1398_t